MLPAPRQRPSSVGSAGTDRHLIDVCQLFHFLTCAWQHAAWNRLKAIGFELDMLSMQQDWFSGPWPGMPQRTNSCAERTRAILRAVHISEPCIGTLRVDHC